VTKNGIESSDKDFSLSLTHFKVTLKEGAKTFFFQGTNGRWKDVLSAEELALYDGTAARVLTPECRAWLERGRAALT
jgi:hypothetical protein